MPAARAGSTRLPARSSSRLPEARHRRVRAGHGRCFDPAALQAVPGLLGPGSGQQAAPHRADGRVPPRRMRDGAVAEWLMAAVLKTAGAQALVSSNLTRSAMLRRAHRCHPPAQAAVSSRPGDGARTWGILPARSTADRSNVTKPFGRSSGRGPSACSPGRGHFACVEQLACVPAREAEPAEPPSALLPEGRDPTDRFPGRCSSRQRMHRPD